MVRARGFVAANGSSLLNRILRKKGVEERLLPFAGPWITTAKVDDKEGDGRDRDGTFHSKRGMHL